MTHTPVDPRLLADALAARGYILPNGHTLHALPESPSPATEWREYLEYKDAKGKQPKLFQHHTNALVALLHCPDWAGRIYFDEHAQRCMVTNPPWHTDDAPQVDTSGAREWTDGDDVRLSAWLLKTLRLELPAAICRQAVVAAAEKNIIHPFRDHISRPAWDFIDRLDSWLVDYFGCSPSTYTSNVGKWWMISAVARTFCPGCDAHHVLILEGPQGIGKSTALRTLVGERWYSSTPIAIGNKDAYLAMQGKVVIELAELDSMRRAEAAAAKAFFTQPFDNFRPPYARTEVKIMRGCIFCGTVNHRDYLVDDSGNRRYWPVMCGVIDIAGLAAMREQLWAEAVYRYKAGEKWWPTTDEERAECGEEQEQRTEEEPWSEPIVGWLSLHPGDMTTTDLLLGAIKGMELVKIDKGMQKRAARVLKDQGYTRIQVREGTARRYVYRKG